MSASLAGKFQDHYVVLGVDAHADEETISRAHAELVQKYGEDTETWDDEKLAAVNLAFEALSDSLLRREFDKLKGLNQQDSDPKFSGPELFLAFSSDAALRLALLSILYDRRRSRPFKPAVSMRPGGEQHA